MGNLFFLKNEPIQSIGVRNFAANGKFLQIKIYNDSQSRRTSLSFGYSSEHEATLF